MIVLAVALAIQALVSMAVLTVPAMAPAMAQELNVSTTRIGAYIAVVYVGAMIASLLSGSLVLRYGAIRVSQMGLLACSAGLTLLVLAPGLAAAAAAAFLIGVGYGPITSASSHLLASTTPPARISLVFSIKQTGVPVGGVMAGAIVPFLLTAGGPDAALLAVGAGNLACAFIAQSLRDRLDAHRCSVGRFTLASLIGPVRLVVSHEPLARMALFSFVFSAVQMCLATYLVIFLHSALGYALRGTFDCSTRRRRGSRCMGLHRGSMAWTP